MPSIKTKPAQLKHAGYGTKVLIQDKKGSVYPVSIKTTRFGSYYVRDNGDHVPSWKVHRVLRPLKP